MKKTKRGLSWLLTLAMVLTLLPGFPIASAAENKPVCIGSVGYDTHQ